MDSTNNNDLSGLRAVLFETLRGPKDGSVKPEQAKAINDVGQTLINSAKLEVDYLRATGGNVGTGFIPVCGPAKPGSSMTPTGIKTIDGNSTIHRLR